MASNGDSHVVTIRYWLGLASTDGLTGLDVQDGIFTGMSGPCAGMDATAEGWPGISSEPLCVTSLGFPREVRLLT